MYEGLIERLSQAKGAIMRHDYEYKADRISKAVGIINGLQSALDNRSNPELGQRMFALYDYMKELLTKASVSLDTAPIDEVINLILPIKQAWDQIPQDIKEKTNQQIFNSFPDYFKDQVKMLSGNTRRKTQMKMVFHYQALQKRTAI